MGSLRGPAIFSESQATSNAQPILVLDSPSTEIFKGYVYAGPDDPAAPYIAARTPILDVGSPRALLLAKACIEDCLRTHGRCNMHLATQSETPLPSRLLDCSDLSRPYVAATNGGHGRYLALSYVWGEAQPYSATTSNIAAYSDTGIDPANLPQTIRDAIYVTHGLGMQYLWVDALCILQDSDEDKRRQLGHMRNIYRGAYLTIIVACSRTAGEGFLQLRPAPARDLVFPFICPSQPPSGPRDRVVRHHQGMPQVGEVHISPTFTASEGALKQYNFSSEPINARGWCLQEYFMSPRSLVFTSKTLRFRCRTAAQNVGNAIDVQDPISEHQLPDILFHTAPPPLERGSAEWRLLYSAWSDIVADYSRRAIGDPSDKLVACGAIAEAFQRALRSDYLAGLWRDSLLNDLLWQPQGGVRISRPAAFRAPSWSWASVDGEVTTWEAYSRGAPDADTEWTPVAEVVRCEVAREVSGLPFGRVVRGSLVLRAAAIPCRLRSGDCEGCALVPAGPLGWYWEGVGEASVSDGAVRSSDLPGWAFLDSIDDAGLEGMLAVPLFQRESRMESLLVVLVDIDDSHTQSKKVYRRVGRFREIWTTGRLRGIGEGQFPLTDIEVV